eukprot:TRINITY_DN300_c0_g2_i1.p1 TRINITY_DN300_c0_g2~~TRINITY_DN300_c0_g2_i1.p1  ORF type:complete len:389 (-),score=84.73 TRINITY_DN300_c0_g2_i1:473-1639(-)
MSSKTKKRRAEKDKEETSTKGKRIKSVSIDDEPEEITIPMSSSSAVSSSFSSSSSKTSIKAEDRKSLSASSTSSLSSSSSSSSSSKKGGKQAMDMKEMQEIEKQFIIICGKNPEGLRNDQLISEMSSVGLDKIMQVVNALCRRGRLNLLKDGQEVVYKLVTQEDAAKFNGLKPEDMEVYNLVEQAKNNGIWVKEIKKRTKLTPQQVTKALKVLVSRKLIKPEKSIAGKNRRVYMLYDLEPAKDVKGGPWYNGADFDSVFFDMLYKVCFRVISSEGEGTPQSVSDAIRKKQYFTVSCTPQDIAYVLLALFYDGMIEQAPISYQTDYTSDLKKPPNSNQIDVVYRVAGGGPLTSEFGTLPCAVCPVADQCHENSVVSPQTCEYYQKWSEF